MPVPPTRRNPPGVRPDWVADELFPFESRFVEVEGGHTIHHVDEGEGPLILMHHGNPTWSFLYRDVIKGLRDRFRCVAVDLPGFGLSHAGPGYGFTPAEHADAMTAFVKTLDLTGITVFVQDWGGPTGLAPAVRMPERYDRLIVGNTWAWNLDGMAATIFSNLMGGPLGREVILRFNLFASRILPTGFSRRKPTDEVLDHYTFPFPNREARIPTAVFPRAITRSRPLLEEVEAGLATLSDRPALILWALKDRAFGKAELERWQRELHNHTTVTLPDSGHFLQDDAHDEVVAAITSWWDTLD